MMRFGVACFLFQILDDCERIGEQPFDIGGIHRPPPTAGCGGGSGSGSGPQSTPVIELSQTAISFAANFGIAYTPVVSPVNVTNTGSGTLKFTATSDSSWLVAAPRSGVAPQSLSISVAPGNLAV